jgi:glucosamine-6-phosphate deaminase
MERGVGSLLNGLSVNLLVVRDAREVGRVGADILASAVSRNPTLVLALPTGQTPILFYQELATRWQKSLIDLSRVRSFNLDELVLPLEDPRTFRTFMERHVWDCIGMDRSLADLPRADAPNLAAECERYDRALVASGGIDLAVLGVGADGHVAYNLPGPVKLSTHVVRLPDTLADSLSVPADKRPLSAVTMGLGTIRAARSILVLATGASKAQAVRALVHGPEDIDWPCSLLREHPSLDLVLDPPAASGL